MKAVIYKKYGPPEVLQLREIETPEPKENEVLVRVKATTVTPVDCVFRSGKNIGARMFTGLTKPKNPVLGNEFSGVVETVGKDVKNFKVGDEVFGGGPGHAEFACVSADGPLAIKPGNLSFEEAAAVPYGMLTALPFLRDSGNIQSGNKVLINGASGSIGTYAVQIAKYNGAQVTGVCSTANVDLVKSLGADKVIDYKKEDFTKSEETWDIIFDVVGKSSYSKSKRVLTSNGIFMTTVMGLPILFQMLWTSKFGSKKANITFTGLRPPEEMARDLLVIKKLVEQGKIKPVIDRTWPLKDIIEATRYVEKGHKQGNAIIAVDG